MRIEHHFGFHWIVGVRPAHGPYEYKKDAEEDLRGLKRFFKRNPSFTPMGEENKMETSIEQRVANLADAMGMWCEDLRRFPDLLREHDIDPEEVTERVSHKAESLNRSALHKLILQYDDQPIVKPKRPRRTILGLPVAKVLRWMGADLWSIEEVKHVLRMLGVPIPKGVCRKHMADGLKNRADIPRDVQEHLYSLAQEF